MFKLIVKHDSPDSALFTINTGIPLCVSHVGLRFNDKMYKYVPSC